MTEVELLLRWLPLFWLIVAIMLGVAEAATSQFIAIWFALGAVVTMIPAALGWPILVQLIVFLVISTLALIFTRDFVKKVLNVKPVATNADSMIGRIGMVTEEISNVDEQGRVMLAGLSWAARAEDGTPIEEGERVLVKAIEGVKVIVEKIV